MQILSNTQAPSRGYRPSPSEATFSPQGKRLAVQTRDTFDANRGDWESNRQLVSEGLSKISEHEGCTSDEKEIAELGLVLGELPSSHEMAAQLQRSVVGTLAAGVPGPMGQVLASTGLAALPFTTADDKVTRGVAQRTLEAVAASVNTSSSEQEVAALGLDFGSGYQYTDEAAALQRSVLSVIERGTSGPMPSVLADVTLKACSENEFREEKTARNVEEKGLRAISLHPESKAADKALAVLGIDFGDDYMYNDDAVKVQGAVLDALARPDNENKSLPQILASATKKAYLTGVRFETGRKILEESFEAILRSSESTEAQRSLAQAGIDLGKESLSDQELCQRRMEILERLG